MTKQEEIREHLAINEYKKADRRRRVTSWQKTPGIIKDIYYAEADRTLAYLASQGCVLKVEGNDVLRATGYTLTMPLIKEQENV